MLEVDIQKKYSDFTLNVSFCLDRDRLALFGPSGSGKSLTLKCIAGIEKPDEGRIVLGDRVLFDSKKKINVPPRKRRVGLLFQNYALFPNMTLQKNIEMGQRSKDAKQIEAIIRDFSLTGLENLYPHQLSGGQQQRVALARMLVNDPEILMLDEPFSALDTHLRTQVEWEVLDILSRYSGRAICVSHSMEETYRFAEQIAIFHDGKIEDLRERDQLFSHPRTLNGAKLIGLRNIAHVQKEGEGIRLVDYDMYLPRAFDTEYVAIPPRALSLEPTRDGLPFEVELIEVLPGIEEEIWLMRHAKGKKLLQLPMKKSRPAKAPGRVTVYLAPEKVLALTNDPLDRGRYPDRATDSQRCSP